MIITYGDQTIGKSHLADSIPCQDKVYTYNLNGFSSIALADGAGSCANSHYGADIAVKLVIDIVNNKFDQYYNLENPNKMIDDIVDTINNAFQTYSLKNNIDVNSLSCTLLFASIHNEKIIIGQIGDGLIGIKKAGFLKALSIENKSDAVNQTDFIDSSKAKLKFRVFKGVSTDIESVFLMSDGTENSLVDKTKRPNIVFAKALDKFIYWISNYKNEALTLISDVLINNISQHTFDDCSLAMLNVINNIFINAKSNNLKLQNRLLNRLKTPCTRQYLLKGINSRLQASKILHWLIKNDYLTYTNNLYTLK